MLDIDLNAFRPEKVWDDAVAVLGEIGLAVDNATALRRARETLTIRQGRAHFPPDVVEHFGEELRQRARLQPAPQTPARLSLSNIEFNCHYLDPRTGQTRPYDTATLIKHSRFVHQLTDEGLLSGRTTGYPLDVPGDLQFVTSYYVECLYGRTPGSFGLANTPRAMRYMIEIAAVMGARHTFGAEPISPLRFAGGSVEMALDLYEEGMAVWVDPMPIVGVTAPMDWHAAWAQSVAENLGSYILYRLCGIEEVHPTFRLFVPNMAAAMICFSSPRHLAAMLTRRKVREMFALPTRAAEFLLVTSKAPDQQAAAEKMAGCLAAAIFGFPHLQGAGSLWLDEIFSPQQLAIDIEIARFVDSMRADLRPSQLDVLEEIRRGAIEGSFLASDWSLASFEPYIWRPQLFDLAPRAAWKGKTILQRAAVPDVDAKAAEYAYELTGPKREQLDRIMERARKELA